MIPFLPSSSTAPTGPAAPRTGAQASTIGATLDPAAASAGRFAEFFNALLPTAPTAAGTDPEANGETADADPDLGNTGSPVAGFPLGHLDTPHLPELAAPEPLDVAVSPARHTGNAPEAQAGTQGTGSAVLGESMLADAEAKPATTGASEVPEDPATPASGRHLLPVTVGRVPVLTLPGAVAPPNAAPFPVADTPMLMLQTPQPVGSIPVAPTPLLFIADAANPAPAPASQSADAAANTPSVAAGSREAVPAAPAVLPGNPGTESSTGKVQSQGAVPDTTHTSPQVSAAGTETGPAPGTSDPVSPERSIPTALVPIIEHGVPVTNAATARPADLGIAPVDSLEAPAAQAPVARVQEPMPLHRQLLGAIATLATGPNGERTLSVNIAPEALGPITLKAHLGGEGIRMDLSAPTDAGRDALRMMLPELRRELAATGAGNVTLGTGGDPGTTPDGSPGPGHRPDGGKHPHTGSESPASGADPGSASPDRDSVPVPHATSHLDVMA